ncbi:tRNA pseudouridine synthase A [Hyella patelloides LEGE 07179]|uniref:tRNA pseudouridine synthase A n=1 Tax=Hyella patelloides LEGE 07179 TaxID=945734 RepID=A0A563VYD3_9CYAN|nr:tRNA pseudouridine(38-40) synthase TruA [Hyella patelloides]VEP16430.1 tRNA pseudouridine synthase A [Hyella patelloides LEGE 07179]
MNTYDSEQRNPSAQRVALIIQYIGTKYNGWQRQPIGRTIQGEIETALASATNKPVTIYGAGRTDAGVHAAAQVAHFNYIGPIPPHKWAKILNSRLPEGILIRASAQVPNDWHACFSASWRRYRYTIYTDKLPNLFVKSVSWHYYRAPLDETAIQQALDPLVGKHELSAFRRTGSNRKHSWVDVQVAQCYRQNSFLHLEIQADGFLYGMMRLLVGLLIEVGVGNLSPTSFTELWQNRQREKVKYSAPAKGLCLLRVGYPVFPFSPEIWFDTQPTYVLAP